MKELRTIKVEPETIQNLNIISGMTGENQYTVVRILAKEGVDKLMSIVSKKLLKKSQSQS